MTKMVLDDPLNMPLPTVSFLSTYKHIIRSFYYFNGVHVYSNLKFYTSGKKKNKNKISQYISLDKFH